MRRRTPPLIPGKAESSWLTSPAPAAAPAADAPAPSVPADGVALPVAARCIGDGDALSLAGDLVQLLRTPGALPELPPEALPRLMHETAATVLAAGGGEGRAARPVTIGGFGSLVIAAACLASLPDAAAVGGIAATQALSAVLGLGVRPMLALAGTDARLPENLREQMLAGVREPCTALALPMASARRLLGGNVACVVLAAGYLPPARFGWRGALPGDRLILAKALGGGLLLDAWRSGELSAPERDVLLAAATQPLTPGPLLACLERVHAQSVVGEGGLLGALLALCDDAPGSVGAVVDATALPILPGARELLGQALAADARRNLDRDGARLSFATAPSEEGGKEGGKEGSKETGETASGAVGNALDVSHASEAMGLLLADTQPGGGLLICCAPEAATEVLAALLEYDFGDAALVGEISAGDRRVTLGGQPRLPPA